MPIPRPSQAAVFTVNVRSATTRKPPARTRSRLMTYFRLMARTSSGRSSNAPVLASRWPSRSVTRRAVWLAELDQFHESSTRGDAPACPRSPVVTYQSARCPAASRPSGLAPYPAGAQVDDVGRPAQDGQPGSEFGRIDVGLEDAVGRAVR